MNFDPDPKLWKNARPVPTMKKNADPDPTLWKKGGSSSNLRKMRIQILIFGKRMNLDPGFTKNADPGLTKNADLDPKLW